MTKSITVVQFQRLRNMFGIRRQGLPSRVRVLSKKRIGQRVGTELYVSTISNARRGDYDCAVKESRRLRVTKAFANEKGPKYIHFAFYLLALNCLCLYDQADLLVKTLSKQTRLLLLRKHQVTLPDTAIKSKHPKLAAKADTHLR